jgi:tagatose 6-phosphate kinase
MIVFLSLSAADQDVWLLPRLSPGEVNRTADVRRCVGGKAVNAARAAASLGAACVVVGFFGRGQGLVERLEAEGIGVDAVRTAAPTRKATSVVDRARGVVTELVEEARAPSGEECAALAERFAARARGAEVVCLCGSVPAGVAPGIYAELMGRIAHPRVIVDAQGEPLSRALAARPFLVKPNRKELADLVGAGAATFAEVAAGAEALCARGARHAAVSCGADGLVLAGRPPVRFTPPRVEVVNSTGCGDAVTGGIAWGLASGLDVREAVRQGVACGTASALDPVPARFDPGAQRDVVARITIDSP